MEEDPAIGLGEVDGGAGENGAGAGEVKLALGLWLEELMVEFFALGLPVVFSMREGGAGLLNRAGFCWLLSEELEELSIGPSEAGEGNFRTGSF